jgi:cell division transport system permease protein
MIRIPLLADRVHLPLRWYALARLLPCVAALSVYLAALAGVGLIAVGDRLHGWDDSLAGTMTLQVPADTSTARLNTVVALLKQTHGIVGVHVFEPAETARLVEPWLGGSVAIDRLPLPRVIDLHVDGPAIVDLTDLRQRLASIVPDARLEAYGALLAELRNAAVRLTSTIAAVLAVVLLVMVLSAASSAGTALLIRRDMIELLQLLGAKDSHIARQFEAQALQLGLIGGGAGAIASALTILTLGSAGLVSQLSAPIPVEGIADWRVWVVLIGAAIASGAVAMAAARVTVLRGLARMI